MNYTKGNEWEAQGNKVKVYGRGIICECPSPQNGGVVEFITNAHLIAQAPKLYEACMKALAITANVVNMPITPQRRIVALLSKAIAPVEGGKK